VRLAAVVGVPRCAPLRTPARPAPPRVDVRGVGLRPVDPRAARRRRPRPRRPARPGGPVGRGPGQHPQGAGLRRRPHGRLGTGPRLSPRFGVSMCGGPRLGVARLRAHGGLRPARQGRRALGEARRPDPRRPPRRARDPVGDRRPPPRGGRLDRGRRAEDHLLLSVADVLCRGAEGALQASAAWDVLMKVSVNGIQLATHEWPGRGPAIVAVHGLTSNHTVWYPIADALAGSYPLLAYDLRGRGDSDKPPTGYSLAHHATDLLALLDHPPLDRAIILGHSTGAHIAVPFATAHPEPL